MVTFPHLKSKNPHTGHKKEYQPQRYGYCPCLTTRDVLGLNCILLCADRTDNRCFGIVILHGGDAGALSFPGRDNNHLKIKSKRTVP